MQDVQFPKQAALSSRKAEKLYPTYCPLSLPFDAERLHAELIALLPRFESLTVTKGLERSKCNLNPSKWFRLGDDYLYENVEHFAKDPSRPDAPPAFIRGSVPGWWGMGLTQVPGLPDSNWGSNRYRRKHDGEWVWKDDVDVPYTRELLQSLPFTRFDVVRVMSLPPGGFGPAHADCKDDAPWELEGIASVTFLLRDGGAPWRLMAPDGRLHDVNDQVFFFKDCAPHGVPQTTSRRLLLRINGAADSQSLLKLMRLEEAIW
jgi:hypothetical protein